MFTRVGVITNTFAVPPADTAILALENILTLLLPFANVPINVVAVTFPPVAVKFKTFALPNTLNSPGVEILPALILPETFMVVAANPETDKLPVAVMLPLAIATLLIALPTSKLPTIFAYPLRLMLLTFAIFAGKSTHNT